MYGRIHPLVKANSNFLPLFSKELRDHQMLLSGQSIRAESNPNVAILLWNAQNVPRGTFYLMR
jgi:hypothetical protein